MRDGILFRNTTVDSGRSIRYSYVGKIEALRKKKLPQITGALQCLFVKVLIVRR